MVTTLKLLASPYYINKVAAYVATLFVSSLIDSNHYVCTFWINRSRAEENAANADTLFLQSFTATRNPFNFPTFHFSPLLSSFQLANSRRTSSTSLSIIAALLLPAALDHLRGVYIKGKKRIALLILLSVCKFCVGVPCFSIDYATNNKQRLLL